MGVVEKKRIMMVDEYSRAGARTGRTVRLCEGYSLKLESGGSCGFLLQEG